MGDGLDIPALAANGGVLLAAAAVAADRYFAWRRERNGDSQRGLLRRILATQGAVVDVLRDTAELHEERARNRPSESDGRIAGLSTDVSGRLDCGDGKPGRSRFRPDDGLETAPILLQKEVEITGDDTLGSIYVDKLFPLGVAAMAEAVDLVRDGGAPRIAQDESGATYESWCRADDVEIDWRKPVAEIYNLVRGSNPQPGAWTTHGGRKFQIFDALRVHGAAEAPGQVAGVTGDASTVPRGGLCV